MDAPPPAPPDLRAPASPPAAPVSRRRWLLPAGVYALILAISLLPGDTVAPVVNEVTAVLGHAAGYVLLGGALTHAARPTARGRWVGLAAVALVLAVVNEALQLLAEGRAASGFDVVVDLVGASLGAVLVARHQRRAARGRD